MGFLDSIKELANTDIKDIFSSKASPGEKLKDELYPDLEVKLLPEEQRENFELFLRDTFKKKKGEELEEAVDYSLFLFDQGEIEKRKEATGKQLEEGYHDDYSETKAGIDNRYLSTFITEVAEEGIFGYSTRDEIRQNKTDAEIEKWLRDPKVKSSYKILSSKVFADPLIVEAAGDSDQDRILKEYIESLMNELKGSFRKTLKEALIVAFSYQNALFEIVPKWSEHPDFKGKRVINFFASKRPGFFEFTTDDQDNTLAIHSLINYDEYYDLERFFEVSFDNMFSNPYGITLFSGSYKYWKAKIILIQEMCIYANRFSQPIPLVKYKESNKEQKAKAQELSKKLYAGAHVAVPEGVSAEFIHALKNGDNPFIPILEWLDKQIGISIAGIDLSQGSYAADKVIADERALMVLDIREDLQEYIFEQIIKPYCSDNFDNSVFTLANYPRIKFVAPKKPLTAEQLTSAIPMLEESGFISTSRLSDVNKIRSFYGFDEIKEEEFNDAETDDGTEDLSLDDDLKKEDIIIVDKLPAFPKDEAEEIMKYSDPYLIIN